MKLKQSVGLLGLWLPLALNQIALAADVVSQQSTGTIEGRVQNEVSGLYLYNARVEAKGTSARAFTDESGSYRLTNVPSGPVVVEVSYTGLESQQIPLTVPSRQSIRQDIKLAAFGQVVVKLTPYEVGATRVMQQEMIAINEQRVAPNMKTVVAIGDLNENPDGFLGEFLKLVPGISGTSALNVRGFPSEFTQVTLNGAATADAQLQGNSRSVETQYAMSSENVARVEVTKVPTPSTGADTMAGSINILTRSAFESPRRVFRYQVNLTGDPAHLSLKKKPMGLKEDQYYLRPSASFSYTHPVNENFGFVITGLWYSRWAPGDIWTPSHNVNSPTFRSTIAKPATTNSNYTSAADFFEKRAISFSADWRVKKHSVISGTIQTYDQNNNNVSYVLQTSTGTVATPTVAGGVLGSFGEDFTFGGTGRGVIGFSNNFAATRRGGYRGDLRYRFDNGVWNVDLQTGQSGARMWLRGPEAGVVNNITANNTVPLRVDYHDINSLTGPGEVAVFNNNNQEVDIHDPSLHDLTAITGVTVIARDVRDFVSTYKADVKRTFGFLPFPAAVKIGGERKQQDRNRRGRSGTYTYNGPGGNQSPALYVWPYPALKYDPSGQVAPVLSPYPLVEAWKANPGLLTQTVAQRGSMEQFRRANSEQIRETVDSFYFQAEARFLKNRLSMLTGVRYEKTTGEGTGALNVPGEAFVHNANGTFALTPTGARIRRPDAGVAGSFEDINLTWIERAAKSKRSYDDFFPSFHLNYNVTEKLMARAAYAKTYGRPNFTFIIPNTVINESTDALGEVVGGILTVRNPALLPWTADNFDLSLEYYTDQGGIFGASIFRKDVRNFFGSVTRDATPSDLTNVGLGANDLGWDVRTTENVGDARIDGVEISAKQGLQQLDAWLGGWGRSFRVFASITKLKLKGEQTASFTGFLPTSANWGLQFARQRVSASARWNYRSRQNESVITNLGVNGFNFVPAFIHLDVNLSYSLRPNLSVFINVRNLLDQKQQAFKGSDELATYARVRSIRNNGIPFNVGISGSF
jgi:iron complex outermembrane receptor protein